jgi:hypothetical protein
MIKFSEQDQNIQENVVKTKEEVFKDKLSNILDKEISVEINEEPKIEENYSIKGKEELLEKIIALYNSNNEIIQEKFSKIYEDKFVVTINKEEIDFMVESLENNQNK